MDAFPDAGMKRWAAMVFCLFVFLEATGGVSSAHLVKEFVTGQKDDVRSIEPNKDTTEATESRDSINVAAVLCQKYTEWSKWSECSRKCDQTRVRRCKQPEACGRSWVKEKRTCTRARGACVPLSYKSNIEAKFDPNLGQLLNKSKVIGMQKRNRMIEELLYDLLYAPWTAWGPCTRSCRQKRQRKCKYKAVCVRSYIQEERRCQVEGSKCEHRYSLKPLGYDEDSPDTGADAFGVNSPDGEEPEDLDDAESDDGEDYDNEETESDTISEGEEYGYNNNGEEDGGEVETFTSGHETESLVTSSGEANKVFTTIPSRIESDSDGDRKRRKLDRPGRGKERIITKLDKELQAAQKECGARPKAASGTYRVVGGQEVRKNSWPWQVAILTKYQEQYCGGTLIAPKWVLTAAHCVRKRGKRRRLVVKVGEHDIGGYDTTEETIRPEKEFPHPDFDYHTITNDIALIKLKHAPSAYTTPGFACLPYDDYKPGKDQLCSIVGWGKLKNTHIFGSDSLMEAKVPVVKHRKCQRVFDYVITENQVCAGYKRGGIDSCAGDSGGPLLCTNSVNGTDDRYVLYGVTSYGEGCGRKGKYGIYTKVSSYLGWIEDTISQNR